jgi:hypothetical protein
MSLSVNEWLNHLDSRKPPEWYHEDCVCCGGNGCEYCNEEEEEEPVGSPPE